MTRLRLAMAQADPTVGDLRGNADLVVDWSVRAAAAGAHLVLFPEMFLTGYPVEDLALRPSFVEASRATALDARAGSSLRGLRRAARRRRLPRPVEPAPPTCSAAAGTPQNAAAVLHGGEVVARYAKHHLPNYGVFDEFRYFVPGDRHVRRARARRRRRARHLRGPLAGRRPGRRGRAPRGAGLLLVINGSPYERNKDDVRLELCRASARRGGLHDRLPRTWSAARTSWCSTATRSSSTADGEVLARAQQFVEELRRRRPRPARGRRRGRTVETVGIGRAVPTYAPEPARVTAAPRATTRRGLRARSSLGLRDYARKNGFTSVRDRPVRRHRLGAGRGDRL